MPKNKGKGGKNRRRGKNDNDDEKRDLIFKEDGQGNFICIILDRQKKENDTKRVWVGLVYCR